MAARRRLPRWRWCLLRGNLRQPPGAVPGRSAPEAVVHAKPTCVRQNGHDTGQRGFRVNSVGPAMDDDDDGLMAAAQEFIERFGHTAVDQLKDLAEIAAGTGDHESAETWRDIARVVERLLG